MPDFDSTGAKVFLERPPEIRAIRLFYNNIDKVADFLNSVEYTVETPGDSVRFKLKDPDVEDDYKDLVVNYDQWIVYEDVYSIRLLSQYNFMRRYVPKENIYNES